MGFSLLYLASTGMVGARDSFPQWASSLIGQHQDAPWLLHIMSHSPRPLFVAWACGGVKIVTCFTWWLASKRQKMLDVALQEKGYAQDWNSLTSAWFAGPNSHRICTVKDMEILHLFMGQKST